MAVSETRSNDSETIEPDTVIIDLEGIIEPGALVDILADGTVVVRDDE